MIHPPNEGETSDAKYIRKKPNSKCRKENLAKLSKSKLRFSANEKRLETYHASITASEPNLRSNLSS